MEIKPCSQCGSPATFSLAFLLTKYRSVPRQQKCTTSVPFCCDCIQALVAHVTAVTPPVLIQPLSEAYTQLARHSNEQPDPTSPSRPPSFAATGPESTRTADRVSSRPRLIAGSSPQIDEAPDLAAPEEKGRS